MSLQVGKEGGGGSVAARKMHDRYLTMRLCNEIYAVDILSVREIIEPVSITRIPRSKEYVRGVINLRGKVISIVDLPCRLGMGPVEFKDQTVIIVLQYEGDGVAESFGIIVDEVLEVVTLKEEDISPPPDVKAMSADERFLIGVGRVDGDVIFLLDLRHTLERSE